jgi:hypothetical protein
LPLSRSSSRACTTLIQAIGKSGFLAFSSGTWATLVARHVFGVERLLEDSNTGRIEDENDAELKARCAEVLAPRVVGEVRDAYSEVARKVTRPDGSAIGVTRVRVVTDGRGNVYVYLATSTGTVAGTANDLATDVGLIDDRIQRTVAPLAVTVHTLGATPLELGVAYKVWLLDTSGLNAAQLAARVQRALELYLVSVPIGGFVIPGEAAGRIYVDDLRAVIGSVAPEIFRVQLVSPTDFGAELTGHLDVAANAAPLLGSATPALIQEAQQRVV